MKDKYDIVIYFIIWILLSICMTAEELGFSDGLKHFFTVLLFIFSLSVILVEIEDFIKEN